MTLRKRTSKSSPSSRTPRRKAGSIRGGHPSIETAKTVPLAEAKDDLSKYLRLAVSKEIVITRHGRPAGVLIGFASDEDWFDYRLEHHLEFLRRIAAARHDIHAGRGPLLGDID